MRGRDSHRGHHQQEIAEDACVGPEGARDFLDGRTLLVGALGREFGQQKDDVEEVERIQNPAQNADRDGGVPSGSMRDERLVRGFILLDVHGAHLFEAMPRLR